jgi:hypothetical protein
MQNGNDGRAGKTAGAVNLTFEPLAKTLNEPGESARAIRGSGNRCQIE